MVHEVKGKHAHHHIPGVEGGFEKRRLQDSRFALEQDFKRRSRVTAGLFAGASAFFQTLAKYVPVMAVALLAASMAGIAISPPIGIVIVAAVVLVGLIAAGIKYFAQGEVFRNHKAHMIRNQEALAVLNRDKAQIEVELKKRESLIKQAESLGIDIRDLVPEVVTIFPENKPKNFKEQIKSLFSNGKSKLGTAEAYLDNGISIFGAIGISFSAVLAVFVTIGAFMGHNIFTLGLLATLGAVTGLTGIGGAVVLGLAIAAVCGVLLANKFFWKVPLKRMQTSMREDELQHALDNKQAHDELHEIQNTNNLLLERINDRLAESHQTTLRAPDESSHVGFLRARAGAGGANLEPADDIQYKRRRDVEPESHSAASPRVP